MQRNNFLLKKKKKKENSLPAIQRITLHEAWVESRGTLRGTTPGETTVA